MGGNSSAIGKVTIWYILLTRPGSRCGDVAMWGVTQGAETIITSTYWHFQASTRGGGMYEITGANTRTVTSSLDVEVWFYITGVS